MKSSFRALSLAILLSFFATALVIGCGGRGQKTTTPDQTADPVKTSPEN